jgi:hypothetical protein
MDINDEIYAIKLQHNLLSTVSVIQIIQSCTSETSTSTDQIRSDQIRSFVLRIIRHFQKIHYTFIRDTNQRHFQVEKYFVHDFNNAFYNQDHLQLLQRHSRRITICWAVQWWTKSSATLQLACIIYYICKVRQRCTAVRLAA